MMDHKNSSNDLVKEKDDDDDNNNNKHHHHHHHQNNSLHRKSRHGGGSSGIISRYSYDAHSPQNQQQQQRQEKFGSSSTVTAASSICCHHHYNSNNSSSSASSSSSELRSLYCCPFPDYYYSRSWIRLAAFLLFVAVVWNMSLIMMYNYSGSGGGGGGGTGTAASSTSVSPTEVQQQHLSQPNTAAANTATTAAAMTATVPWLPLPESNHVVTKLAFGSCSSQHMPMTYWDTVAQYEPDLVLLMGDNVYGDCDEPTCETLRLSYDKMARHPSVQGFARAYPVFATLDDHDYGQDGCGADNPYKDVAKTLFADFFHIDETTQLPVDGVYRSAVFGPVSKRLQIILLDTRYNRSPLFKTGNRRAPYTPPNDNDDDDDNATTAHPQIMLGSLQWEWLERQLQAPADLRLIVSSIQVLSDTTAFESWRLLPKERKRLYRIIQKKNVIFLSGDRHMGAVYETADKTVTEITASSWTHTRTTGTFGNCTAKIIADTNPEAGCDEYDPRRITNFVRVNNFGTIDIDWINRTWSASIRGTETRYAIWEELYYRRKYRRGKASNAGEPIISISRSF